MKFTTEQINGNGIVVNFLKQSAIAHTAEEAEAIINTFKNQHGQPLSVNEHAKHKLSIIFSGEEDQWERGHVVMPEVKTTGCSKYSVRFFPAMAPTIEEHNAIYEAQLEDERAERKRLADEAKQRLLTDYSEVKRGWYYVSVELTALTIDTMRRKYMTNSGYGLADSKMDAYTKFVAGLNDECCKRGLIYESCSAWNSPDTIIDFLGMKTDDGYSIEAWEEFSKTDEYKQSL